VKRNTGHFFGVNMSSTKRTKRPSHLSQSISSSMIVDSTSTMFPSHLDSSYDSTNLPSQHSSLTFYDSDSTPKAVRHGNGRCQSPQTLIKNPWSCRRPSRGNFLCSFVLTSRADALFRWMVLLSRNAMMFFFIICVDQHSVSAIRRHAVHSPQQDSSVLPTPHSNAWGKIHVLRRLHANPQLRQHMADMEERMYRYQTGLSPDPNHTVSYRGHPFDIMRQERERQSFSSIDDGRGMLDIQSHRQAQDNNYTSSSTTTFGESQFRPMRFTFETLALDSIRDSSNAAKIDWFKAEVLPRTASFWSSTLSVVPVSGNLLISAAELQDRTYCGDVDFTPVPTEHISSGVPDTDLILYVSGSNNELFCPPRTLAVAVPCNFDQV
jgi:hypothetical protein